MTADEMLRKRARKALCDLMLNSEGIVADDMDIGEKDVDAVLQFASEQSALARAEAIAECAALCRDLGKNKTSGAYNQCAEAISSLSPAGDRVLVPRVPTKHMIDAGYESGDWGPPGYCDNPNGASSPENVYKAMLAAAERKD